MKRQVIKTMFLSTLKDKAKTIQAKPVPDDENKPLLPGELCNSWRLPKGSA